MKRTDTDADYDADTDTDNELRDINSAEFAESGSRRAPGTGQRTLRAARRAADSTLTERIEGIAARSLGAALGIFLLALAGSSPAAAQALFVVSQNNASILKYNQTTGAFVSTFVAPVTQGFQGLGGIRIHPTSGILYASSTGTGEIWKYTTATGALITPRAAGSLIGPGSMGFDATGTFLYFVDAFDGLSVAPDSVKKLAVATGVVSNVLTDALAEFNAVTVNGSNLYVSDGFNNRIMSYTTSGGSPTQIISGLSLPGAILFRSATDLVFSDTGSDRVLEYTFNGAAWVFSRVVLPATAGVDGPCGLALGPDGRLTVSGCFSNNVVAVDLTTLAVSTLVAPGVGGLNNPKGVAWNGSTLLVASLATNTILYYNSTGTPTGTIARGIAAPTDGGMTFTPAGNLIAASSNDNDLAEFDGTNGGTVRNFFDACPTSLAAPFDVAVGSSGDVYATCTGSDGVFHFTSSGTPLNFFVSAGSGGLTFPRGLAFGPNGNLFVASGFTGEILQYNRTTGAFVNVFVNSAGNGGGAMDPYGITFRNGNLYVASFFPNEVKRFNGTTGAFVSTFVTSGSGGLSGPTAVDFGPDGNLYVSSYNDNSIRRYNGTTGAFLSTFVSSGSGGLAGPIDFGFQPTPPTVPPLSSVGLCVLIASLVLAGLLRARQGAHAGKASA